jgi:hypothetical protein
VRVTVDVVPITRSGMTVVSIGLSVVSIVYVYA